MGWLLHHSNLLKRAGGGGGSVLEAVRRGVHGEDDVEVADDLAREPLVELLGGVQHVTLPLGSLLTLGHQHGVLVTPQTILAPMVLQTDQVQLCRDFKHCVKGNYSIICKVE